MEKEKTQEVKMHQFLFDSFWIYIILTFVSFGVIFYFTPKLVRFLDELVDAKRSQRRKKKEPDKAEPKNKNRYKTF